MVEPGGSDIENREQLVAWLEDKPPDWAVATTARIALRVVPFVWAVEREGSLDRVTNRRMTLTTLRATAISWFAIANRTRGIATAAVAVAVATATATVAATADATADADDADTVIYTSRRRRRRHRRLRLRSRCHRRRLR